MPSVVHVVVTANFAGVERYVSNVARETAGRGWDVAVVGGHPEQMPVELGDTAAWLPGATAFQALRSLHRVGRRDVCHAHMTLAEAVAVAARPLHRAPVVSTRHFAARRGASRGGRLLSRWIARRLTREIAVSDYVASRVERRPDAVILNGVPPSPCLWRSSSRTVLVLQRLEPEKDTITALCAWKASRLVDEGWVMRVVGDGSERVALEAWVTSECVEGVTFVGWVPSANDELANAGVLLAPARSEPFGLAVVEAMAAGIPVVGSEAGGHLETVGNLRDAALFPPGSASSAALGLRSLLTVSRRELLSEAGQRYAAEHLTTAAHVDSLFAEYDLVVPRQARLSIANTRSSNDLGVNEAISIGTMASKPEPEWAAAQERYAFVRELLAIERPAPADLVELGAAPGVQCIALARDGYRVTAVDLGVASEEWGDSSSGSMADALAGAGVDLVLWDLEATPYPLPSESFDVVLLTEVLEHLRDYPLKALVETRRLLRPGGLLVLTTPNTASLQNRARLILGRSVHTPLRDWMFGLPHARHAREYTASELQELVREAGLDVVHIYGRHFHVRSGRHGILAVAAKRTLDGLARLYPSFGSGLAVLAARPPTEPS